jgi:hypothetical protein
MNKIEIEAFIGFNFFSHTIAMLHTQVQFHTSFYSFSCCTQDHYIGGTISSGHCSLFTSSCILHIFHTSTQFQAWPIALPPGPELQLDTIALPPGPELQLDTIAPYSSSTELGT